MGQKITGVILLLIGIALVFFKKSPPASIIEDRRERIQIKFLEYKKIKPNLSYKDSVPEMKIENLIMIGEVGKFGVGGHEGKILRVARFENVTDAIEHRYNLPRHILAAMMMEESGGVDLLPNGLGDGGFGLCHMQSDVAKDFGLRVYANCNGRVCNGKDKRSCRKNGKRLNHALELKQLIAENQTNRREVIKYDERLHPVINLDAVGRMLASYMDGPKIKYHKNFGPLRTAIARYAGIYNYEAYWKDVRENMKMLASAEMRRKVEKDFNKLNPNLRINGSPADFKMYIELSQEQNYNYGLVHYKTLPIYLPKNSEKVLRTISNF